MKGKTILITGATSGIGLETAKALAGMGAKIIITTRNQQKADAIVTQIIEKTGNPEIKAMYCRLDDLSSVKAFAMEFIATHDHLDILINNAGIWETERKLSVDGIEMTFAVNHLAPFLLTQWLLPLLKRSAPSRIISVSSQAHKNATLNFNDLESEHGFSFMGPYAQSKLANILFTRHLASLIDPRITTVNCLHPGVVNTSIFHNMNPMLTWMFRLIMISPEKGATTSIFLASSEKVSTASGEYFSKCKPAKVSAEAADKEIASRLWEVSKIYTRAFLPDYAL
jgi:NAD(P)-dependent dehydrogenase (short-subunit alcohol dehydrogenase family)